MMGRYQTRHAYSEKFWASVAPRMKSDRNAEIVRRVAAGDSGAVVARDLGISRERVYQIIERERAYRERGGRLLSDDGDSTDSH